MCIRDRLAPIVPFKNFDDVVEEANRLPYGLAAFAFTNSAKTAEKISSSIESGIVSINQPWMPVVEVPFGGVKESGLGVVNGEEGLLAYAHAMPIIIGKKSASAYPYTDKSFEQLKGALKIFWGNRLVRKLFG